MYFGIESSNADNTYIYSILNKNITRELNIEEVEQDLLAKVNMTGVTAISRVLAKKVDASGDYEYPAEYIGDFLADADLTHTSNEVSFVDGCAVYSGMRFCSNPEYMAALLKSGIDVVELTGNHNNDFGATYSASSIDMYVDAGIRYFGGGLDTEDAAEILYEEVEGTTIAFIGYNYYDTMLGTGAIASDSRSGANSYSVSKMESNIAEAKENADIVIVDFQFQECWSYPDTNRIYPVCYEPLSSPDQKGVFRMAVDFGADIVVGTQAHQPQTFELYDDGVIFYGLGNLYFDQTNWIGTRQGMVLTHYFYSGEYIQTKITPIYMNDNLQPEFATEAQGDLLMELLKDAR
jgi:poly-gamma-glutamate synthesis protein (capsule biosynthesis protein)